MRRRRSENRSSHVSIPAVVATVPARPVSNKCVNSLTGAPLIEATECGSPRALVVTWTIPFIGRLKRLHLNPFSRTGSVPTWTDQEFVGGAEGKRVDHFGPLSMYQCSNKNKGSTENS